MTFNQLLDKVFQHPDLITRPPVLLDIGASGSLHQNWESIARYSVCIAFDPDDREMDFINNKAKNFRQLHVINKIVTDRNTDDADFYLTSSPYCSSMLQPDNMALSDWAFADLFKVEKKIKLPTINLQKVFNDVNINYVDWFKSDSQGLDLRLFRDLGPNQYNVVIADFEPGFIDAYKEEDKIKDLLQHMDGMPFWLNGFVPGMNYRMNTPKLSSVLGQTEIDQIRLNTQPSAIYAEMTFINDFKQSQLKTDRYYLLGCVFSLILKQYGFAAELAISGLDFSGNIIFKEILEHIKQLTRKPTIGELLSNPTLLKKKVINKIVYKLRQQL